MLEKLATNILGAGVVATDSSILPITNEDTSTEISGNEEEEDKLAIPRPSGDNERAVVPSSKYGAPHPSARPP